MRGLEKGEKGNREGNGLEKKLGNTL